MGRVISTHSESLQQRLGLDPASQEALYVPRISPIIPTRKDIGPLPRVVPRTSVTRAFASHGIVYSQVYEVGDPQVPRQTLRRVTLRSMDTTISTVADFDKALLAEYARFVGDFPDEPESFVQRRFAQYGVFPKLGWALIGAGEAQALASKDPAILYGTISRFIKCAHSCWGSADERGIHWGGYDFCSLVVPSLYSALLGTDYIAAQFGCGRAMSTNGYGAYRHAANLMVCLECDTWKFTEKAMARARAFISSDRNSRTDRAFVSVFIGVLTADRALIAAALASFSEGYLKSDWGRHNPLTKSTFVQALISYANCYLADAVALETHRSLVSIDRIELWRDLGRNLAEYQRNPHRFAEPLGFLNDLTVREAGG